MGTPPSGGLNARGVAKYSLAILDLSKDISRKQCKIGGKLVLGLITNRMSYMSFRLVKKSETLFFVVPPNSVGSGGIEVVEEVVVKSSRSPSHLLRSLSF